MFIHLSLFFVFFSYFSILKVSFSERSSRTAIQYYDKVNKWTTWPASFGSAYSTLRIDYSQEQIPPQIVMF